MREPPVSVLPGRKLRRQRERAAAGHNQGYRENEVPAGVPPLQTSPDPPRGQERRKGGLEQEGCRSHVPRGAQRWIEGRLPATRCRRVSLLSGHRQQGGLRRRSSARPNLTFRSPKVRAGAPLYRRSRPWSREDKSCVADASFPRRLAYLGINSRSRFALQTIKRKITITNQGFDPISAILRCGRLIRLRTAAR